MRYSVASSVALAAAVVASPVAQGVTEDIKPDSAAPSGCSPSYDGDFQIQVVNVTQSASKRSLSKVRFPRNSLRSHCHMLTIKNRGSRPTP
jgi:hypothetical protein